MARVSITFRLPEDAAEHDAMINGRQGINVLRETLAHVRRLRAAGGEGRPAVDVLEEVERVIVEEARDRRVPVE
jgi:hypothetical protein